MTFEDDPNRDAQGEDGDTAPTEPAQPPVDDDARPDDESELDEQLEETFPASDPPANY